MIIVIEYLAIIDDKLVKMKHTCREMPLEKCIKIIRKDKQRVGNTFSLCEIDTNNKWYDSVKQYKGRLTDFGYTLE